MLQRSNILRPMALFLASATWIFFLFALGSFHPNDWPSHAVFPYPPIQNACGSVGAFAAYWVFLAIGQGVFPLLFFSGVCLALTFYHAKLTAPWLRVVGLLLLSIAFAALLHHFQPGSKGGFPEGQGGVIGIAASAFLQAHFNTIGARLVMLSAIFIGLLLAADDVVLRAPGFAAHAYTTVKSATPKMSFPFRPHFKFPTFSRNTAKEALALLKPPRPPKPRRGALLSARVRVRQGRST